MTVNVTGIWISAAACCSAVFLSCKQPEEAQLLTYEGKKLSYQGEILSNGRMQIKVIDEGTAHPAKLHKVNLEINKSEKLSAEGILVNKEDIKLTSGKLEVLKAQDSSGNKANSLICFLSGTTSLAGGDLQCANFREACEGTNSDDKALYGGSMNDQGTICQCFAPIADKDKNQTQTQVSYETFRSRDAPGLLCEEAFSDLASLQQSDLTAFSQACKENKGTLTRKEDSKGLLQCKCSATESVVDILSTIDQSASSERNKTISSRVQAQCRNQAEDLNALCTELDSAVQILNDTQPTGAELKFARDGTSEVCKCTVGGKDTPLAVSLAEIKEQSELTGEGDTRLGRDNAIQVKALECHGEGRNPPDSGASAEGSGGNSSEATEGDETNKSTTEGSDKGAAAGK